MAESGKLNLRQLDVLRACLALMVLLGHARMLLWVGWRPWVAVPHGVWEKMMAYACSVFRYGDQAVAVFFALSGFFIHLRAVTMAARGQVEGFAAADYLRRRARRILPPYYAVLVFTVMLDVIGWHWWPRLYHAQTGDAMLDANFGATGYGMNAVLPALLAQPNLLGIRFGSNGPLWSIGTEVFYYALYPLFMLMWTRNRVIAYSVGIGLGVLNWFSPWAGWWSGAMSSYPIWLGGALVAEAAVFMSGQRSRLVWCAGTVCSLAAFALTHLHEAATRLPLKLLLYVFMGAGAVVMVERLPFDLMTTRLGRFMEWLGIRSYSIYIFHFPVLALMSAWWLQSHGERPMQGWLALVGVLLSLGAGLTGFWLIERRFLPVRLQA